jgi:ribosome-binding factor A
MANKAFPRHQRVAQQIQRTLSELIRREIRDPRLGMVTLTEVRVSKDMSYATIYYSVLGADQAKAQEVLDAAADLLRGPLGRALQLRHSPHLKFVLDELIETGARLSGLINKAVNEDVARHVDDPEAVGGDTSAARPDYDSDDDDSDDAAPDDDANEESDDDASDDDATDDERAPDHGPRH